jgi:hypothetical protein
MKTLFAALVLLAGLTMPLGAADPELAGNWIGAVDTDRGPMDIGLTLTVEKGKLVGVLKTGHGDWAVTAVTEKDGQWTVNFKGGDNEGRLIGRVKDGKFSGDWKSAMANGTFALTRAKEKKEKEKKAGSDLVSCASDSFE